VRNPFKPTAGARPPLLVGREHSLDMFEEGLGDGSGAPGLLTIVCDQLYVGRLSSSFRPFQWLVSCQKSSKNPATGNVLRDGFRIGPGLAGPEQ